MDERTAELAQKGLYCIRKDLSDQYPYMRPAIYYLTPVSDEKEKRLSTDGTCLFYHPEYVLSCFESKKKYSGLVYQFLHILMHCLLGHVCKKYEENAFLYDECADYLADRAIERMTGKARRRPGRYEAWEEYHDFKRKTGGLSVSGLRDYCRLQKERAEYLQKIGKYVYSDNHQYWTKENPASPARKGNDRAKGAGGDWQLLWSQVVETADMMKRGGLCAGNRARESQEERTASAENTADYKSLLQRMCSLREVIQTTDAEFDYIWYETGIALYGNIPLIEPAECAEEPVADDIIIAIDTSGSCSGDVASRFLRETCNLLRDMNIRGNHCRIRILQCDSGIQNEILIQSKEEIPDFQNQMIYGYGGTDFRPVFAYIEECRKKGAIRKVSGLIYLTDAEGIFPEQRTDYETVFVVWNAYDAVFWEIPDWITKVKLTEEDMEEFSV